MLCESVCRYLEKQVTKHFACIRRQASMDVKNGGLIEKNQMNEKPKLIKNKKINEKKNTKTSSKEDKIGKRSLNKTKLALKFDEPKDWKEIMNNIRKMRGEKKADVDSTGAEMAVDREAPPKIFRYQTLIALMLSSQTKDPVTYAAVQRLREIGLTVEKISEMDKTELEKIIIPVAFYKRKAEYLINTSKILLEKYSGDIPNTLDNLMALPGVGQKMAHICMHQAWNETTGIGVDTHVHKVSKRLGWVAETNDPDKTRIQLETWMPREIWSEIYDLFAGFGQTICLSVNPKCNDCLNCDVCPKTGVEKKKGLIKKKKNIDIEECA